MVGPEARLVDPEGPLVGRPGARQIAQVLQHIPQVVDVDCDLGVVRAESGLGKLKCSRVAGSGSLELGTGFEIPGGLVEQPPRVFEVSGRPFGVAGGCKSMGQQCARRRPG